MKNVRFWCRNLKKLNLSLAEKILMLAPVAIWFSYYPNFYFGRAEGLNFELSISLIYVVILATFGIREIWHNRRRLIEKPAVWISGVFVGWNFLSLLWAINPIRGFLNSGVWLILWLCFLAIISMKNFRKMTPYLGLIFVLSAVGVSLLAVFQVAYGAWFDWGLCAGCLAKGFGFVRPSVFAIEPQFLGSLLIAPILLVFSRVLIDKVGWLEKISLLLMLMAMYLTLSRGAIFALILALVLLMIIIWRRCAISLKNIVIISMTFLIIGFGSGMVWHGVFTELNPRLSDGFYDAVSKSVNQLSLGKISLPENQQTEMTPAVSSETTEKKAIFDGYVEKSTNERVKLNDLAIKTWLQNPKTITFGVGAGSAGRAIYQSNQVMGWDFEIVQNEYLSILLELGLVGLALFVAVLIGLFRKVWSQPWFLAALTAYLLQWNFFSGLPNALHIYLVAISIFAIIDRAHE